MSETSPARDPFAATVAPDVSAVIAAAAAASGFSTADLVGPSRSLPLVHWRQVAISAARVSTGLSYPALGRAFGRDHRTVMHACRRVDASPAAHLARDQVFAMLAAGEQMELFEVRAIDDNATILASVEVIGRAGASEFEVGYLHDDVPSEEAAWYAHAKWRGVRLQVDNQRGPVEAAEALVRRILEGGTCTHCGRVIHLGRPGYGCCWTRSGNRWVRGCVS